MAIFRNRTKKLQITIGVILTQLFPQTMGRLNYISFLKKQIAGHLYRDMLLSQVQYKTSNHKKLNTAKKDQFIAEYNNEKYFWMKKYDNK